MQTRMDSIVDDMKFVRGHLMLGPQGVAAANLYNDPKIYDRYESRYSADVAIYF